MFPMACNIQLVCYCPIAKKVQGAEYRSPTTGDDILVKALLNERETYLPAQTDNWPYYKWQDLRQYYLNKIKEFEK